MQSISRLVLVGLCVSVANRLEAQSVDVASRPAQPAARTSLSAAPDHTVHGAGSAKMIILPFGPYITQTGVGGGGADVSEL